MKYSKSVVSESLNTLKAMLPAGSKIYTDVTHVARSGMSRSIRVLLIRDSERSDITYHVARVLGESMDDKNGGLKVSGCGMDMGFEVVYRLGYALFPNGFDCVGENCPSNEHSSYYQLVKSGGKLPEHTCLDHIKRQTGVCHDLECIPWHHSSGGYVFRQEWL